MLDHLGIHVSEFERSRRFFEKALAPLGYSVLMQPAPSVAGFGRAPKPDFWIRQGDSAGPVHVAFASEDRKTVDAFHAATLAAGGRDNGAPGVGAHYHPGYYGAFVLDPDGNNIEAVCHTPV